MGASVSILTSRSSTAHYVRWTVFKSQFCGFAEQKYPTKPQLKNCRLARRYVVEEFRKKFNANT
jgi:hypothetical protein